MECQGERVIYLGPAYGRQDGERKRSPFRAPHGDGNLRREENWRFLIETRRQRTVRVSLYSEHAKAFMGCGGPYGHQKRWWRVSGDSSAAAVPVGRRPQEEKIELGQSCWADQSRFRRAHARSALGMNKPKACLPAGSLSRVPKGTETLITGYQCDVLLWEQACFLIVQLWRGWSLCVGGNYR